MLNIIAHRGFWNETHEKNTVESFRLALVHGFGIETDIRDFNGQLVISHDVPSASCITFKEFMSVVREYPFQTLSLNIKSDGLQQLAKQDIDNYSEYFFFDMAVPDALGFMKNDLIFYTRYSDIESQPCLIAEAAGIWLDNFSSNTLDIDALECFLGMDKKVVLVSPELHGYEYIQYWNQLQKYLKSNPKKVRYIGICTDEPLKAKEFFKNVG